MSANPGARRWQLLPGWALLLGGAVAFWVVGFLPWIATGMQLDSSSAWPAFYRLENPWVALPFGEQRFGALAVGAVIGGVAALALARLAAPRVRFPRLLATTGALLALGLTLGQTVLTAVSGFDARIEAKVLLTALVATAVAATFLGILAGAGMAGGSGWGWLLGGAITASLVSSWLGGLLVDPPERGTGPTWEPLLRLLPWVGGLALGVVLAVFGWRPLSRLLGWVVALGIAWTIPALLVALNHATLTASRTHGLRGSLPEIVDSTRDVFVQALRPEAHHLGPFALALIVGAVGAAAFGRPWRGNPDEHVAPEPVSPGASDRLS